jgi:hypothetical protein
LCPFTHHLLIKLTIASVDAVIIAVHYLHVWLKKGWEILFQLTKAIQHVSVHTISFSCCPRSHPSCKNARI